MRTRRTALSAVAPSLVAAWALCAGGGPAAAQPSISHDPEDPRPTDSQSPRDTRAADDGRPATETKPPSEAKPAADRKPVAAVLSATSDGLDQLRQAVLDAAFTDDLTVRQAFRQLRAEEAIGRLIQSADQRGPPRWFDNGRCEVRLELSGSAIADAIQAAAQARHDDPDLSPRRLAPDLARLRRQTFSVVGTSSAAAAATGVVADDVPARPPTNRPSPRAVDARLPQAPRPTPPVAPPSGGSSPGFAASRGFAASPDHGPVSLRLPRWPIEAPAWAAEQASAKGRADGAGLRGARAAEAAAVAQLRRQVEDLQLAADLSVGQACKGDPSLARALGDAVASAQVEETLYERQQVTVRVSMDLSVVWRRLSAARSSPTPADR